jgi:23S rRNA pseudouridine2605 synthase
METDKLQKIIANIGLTSRRKAEDWIKAGRVSVNGSVAKLGDRAKADDKIRVDGKLIQSNQPIHRRMIAYHKPEGEICTRNDPEGRASVFDVLPSIKHGRWINIGRLDINTSGLIFFTNDGELANRLMHPSYQVLRKYAVRVRGEVTKEMTQQLIDGIELDDGWANFDSVIDAGGEGSNHWYTVTLKEGRNREVRRLWEALGLQVSRLHRIQYGEYELPRSLKRGRWQDVAPKELADFENLVGLKKSPAPKKAFANPQNKDRSRDKMRKLKARRTYRK